ncbi:uncharacterized protein LOC133839655 [Drosophila sulfurigaster albostrigata]|uniref:Uncharacterized protein LOC117573567 n=1 Tax=Drosophila albomicans TaxID=7291 RepID=A0A6P8XN00_DROAB|nr:uncharacterized protein LOC117573567 [Drosophila albomicans]XP_060646124.1 uncharacterized protein LOC132784491 [Drosophila nasuta]XP_062127275.1 uncharacterized protein LOC133839655 [Drosophila sulfurigaster albostrigata]
MPVPKKQSFLSRNLVAVVMIPSLIGIHYGWKVLQDNRKLVTVEEQIDLPPITLAKYVWKRLTTNEAEK